jgi:hypothetical protein
MDSSEIRRRTFRRRGRLARLLRPEPAPSPTRPADTLFGVPAIMRSGGPETNSQRLAHSHLAQANLFEELLRGDVKDIDLNDLPIEYRYMLGYWPEAFHYYRFCLMEYLERILGLSPWNATVRSELMRAQTRDPTGFARFEEIAWRESDRFATQRINAVRRYTTQLLLLNQGTRDAAVQTLLSTYADLYEIEFSLWYLGVLARAVRTGRFRPEAFGGPKSRTSQDALIKQVEIALRETPFFGPFSLSYDPALRHATSHNSYRLVGSGTEIRVEDSLSGRRWESRGVSTLVLNSLQLVQAVATSLGYVHEIWLPKTQRQYRDRGLISIEANVTEEGIAEFILLQLWCFRDIDPAGEWIDEATIRFSLQPSGLEQINLSEQSFFQGAPWTTGDLGTVLREHGWARVQRVPAAPNLDLGYPVFERPDGAEYEILGPGDEHIVRVDIS